MNEDKSARYHRLRRRAVLLGTAWQAIYVTLLMTTGAAVALRGAVASVVGTSLVPLTGLYVLLLASVYGVVGLPLAYYRGVVLERRYQLSTETSARWWADQIKAAAVLVAYVAGAAIALETIIRISPERWWVAASILVAVWLVVLGRAGPVLLARFYDLKAIERESLRSRLVSCADRVGAPVTGVFEWRIGDRTKKANARLVGLGRTRRILISDTLLAGHSDEEIETVVAHELAHHVYGDIWSSIVLEVVLATVGFYLTDAALTRYAGILGLDGKADVAGLPLLLAMGGLVSLVSMPLVNAMSRAHERRADRYALDTTRNSAAFISAMKRLSARNLAEERPSPWVKIFFHTHPSTSDRIAAARAWEPRAP